MLINKVKKPYEQSLCILGFPVFKAIIYNGKLKKYFFGIKVSVKQTNMRMFELKDISREYLERLEREILRFDGIQILKERENLELGDKE